ncbi:hypothetical protein LCGC14_1475720 [marine sediment metagenome]|uniref:Uncharacterized protein n=1 Tax=marine sediment metagenome TaxID=412755 RepID=A0A0F9JX04_9ZZZZ
MAESIDSTSSPETPAPPADESASSTATADETKPAPAVETLPQSTDDDAIYDDAVKELLVDDQASLPGRSQEDTGNGKATDAGSETPTGDESPQFTDAQIQLMSRVHIEPALISGWPAEKQTAFLENAAKREADQTTAYKAMQDELEQAKKGDGGDGDDGQSRKQSEAASQATGQETPISELRAGAEQDVTELEDVYGPEFGGLNKVHGKLFTAVEHVDTRLGEVNKAQDRANQVTVEFLVDNAMNGLVGEYPSSSKPEVRRQLETRFFSDWKQEGNPHATGKEPLCVRIRGAVEAAAKALLGTTTEAAAQVALLNKNKQRLKEQPQVGSGRGQARPLTDDEMYDQEVKKMLAAAT